MVVKVDKVLFEEALDMTGFGKFNILLFGLVSSIITGMTFEIMSVAYLVPGSACELGTTSVQQGMMAGVPLMGVIMTSHVWGYLADTRGRRKILTLSMSIGFVTGALAAFSTNWIMLAVLKFCSSAAVSGAFALSLTLLGECTPTAKRSTLVILTTSIFLATSGLMAVIAIPILPLKFSYHIPFLNIQFNSWRVLDLIFSVPSAVSAIGMARAYESPKYLLSQGRADEAIEVLSGIFALNSGKEKKLYRVNSLVLDEGTANQAGQGFWKSLAAQTLPMFKPPLLTKLLLLAVLYVIVFISINPFTVWLPYMINGFMISAQKGETLTFCQMIYQNSNSTITEQTHDCSMNEMAMTMVFVTNIILAALNIACSSLLKYVGRKGLLIGIQMVSGVAALFVNLTTTWWLSAALLLTYLSGVLNFGFLSTYSVDVFPTYVKAMAVCLTLMVGRGSGVIGINLLKSMLDHQCENAFYIFGSVMICGGITGLLLPSDAKIAQMRGPDNNNTSKGDNSKDTP